MTERTNLTPEEQTVLNGSKPKTKQPDPPKPPAAKTFETKASEQSPAIATHRDNAARSLGVVGDVVSHLTQTGLENAGAYIERKSQKRSQDLEKVSDVLAYLHSPQIFEAEAWALALQKMGVDPVAYGSNVKPDEPGIFDSQDLDTGIDFRIKSPVETALFGTAAIGSLQSGVNS